MLYCSTRGKIRDVSFEDVVFSGYALDGGLYVPQTIPIITESTLIEWSSLNFAELTSKILSLFVNKELIPLLPKICKNAFKYFDKKEIIPIKQIDSNVYICEAFHGQTLAFKDIGLNILAQIMEQLLILKETKTGNKQIANVLCETSGDTGPAAVNAVTSHCKHVNIFCMFPNKYVTKMQARQLTTKMPKYNNVKIYATDSTSDEQALIVKNIFKNVSFTNKYNITSMNSINWVRIATQICYYFWSYLQINKNVTTFVDFAIPSGAFGNTCACTFAKCMGLPIRNIIPCTNRNDIVYRTLINGDFSAFKNDYKPSMAPACDCVVPYNIERFFYLAFNQNCKYVSDIMSEFEKGIKSMNFNVKFDKFIPKLFFKKYIKYGYSVSDSDIKNTISYMIKKYNYVCCPHSVCGIYGALTFLNEKHYDKSLNIPMIAIATAHPSKFETIIKDSVKNTNIKPSQYEYALSHHFLPKPNEPEFAIQLKMSNNFMSKWSKIIMNDIISMNNISSKL